MTYSVGGMKLEDEQGNVLVHQGFQPIHLCPGDSLQLTFTADDKGIHSRAGGNTITVAQPISEPHEVKRFKLIF